MIRYIAVLITVCMLACHSSPSPVKITDQQRDFIYDSLMDQAPSVLYLWQDTLDPSIVNFTYRDYDMFLLPRHRKQQLAFTACTAMLRHLGPANGLRKATAFFMDYTPGEDEDYYAAFRINIKLDSLNHVLFPAE